jgi:segregation and condensation protein A
MSVPCTVKLELFEGPLDLLLHLIKRNEVSITDIPVATITDQYLALLNELPELNLDTAGEYLVMAATLMHIKSRMLLPVDDDAEEDEIDDPRAALVQQLLEYQRYREAAEGLASRLVLERDVFAPPGEPLPPGTTTSDDAPPVRDASLGDLLDALRGVLARLRKPGPHEVAEPGMTVAIAVERVLAHFALATRIEFTELFGAEATRSEVIVTFLALLEMIRLKVLRALQQERFGPIGLELAVGDLTEAAERSRTLTTTAGTWGGEGNGPGDAGILV